MVVPLYPSFSRYMESSRHLVFYRLNSHFSPPSVFYMPHVEQLSVIHCASTSISSILNRKYFPSLQRIHYLSGPPSDPAIHRQFSKKIDWIFPMGDYPFYNRMVEAGYGRRDEWLIRNYLVCEKWINGSLWFDLYLPSRGIVSGEWYYRQQMAFFYKKEFDQLQLHYPIQKEQRHDIHYLPDEAITITTPLYDSRWIYQQECIERSFLAQINHPDATPFHNSNK